MSPYAHTYPKLAHHLGQPADARSRLQALGLKPKASVVHKRQLEDHELQQLLQRTGHAPHAADGLEEEADPDARIKGLGYAPCALLLSCCAPRLSTLFVVPGYLPWLSAGLTWAACIVRFATVLVCTSVVTCLMDPRNRW